MVWISASTFADARDKVAPRTYAVHAIDALSCTSPTARAPPYRRDVLLYWTVDAAGVNWKESRSRKYAVTAPGAEFRSRTTTGRPPAENVTTRSVSGI